MSYTHRTPSKPRFRSAKLIQTNFPRHFRGGTIYAWGRPSRRRMHGARGSVDLPVAVSKTLSGQCRNRGTLWAVSGGGVLLWPPTTPPTLRQTVLRAAPEPPRSLTVVPPLPIRRYYGEAPVGLPRYERVVADATPLITPKIARFVPICIMEDIGTNDDWAAAQRVFILSGVPKGMGVSTEQRRTRGGGPWVQSAGGRRKSKTRGSPKSRRGYGPPTSPNWKLPLEQPEN
jgi:hypothetical protein